MGEIFRIALVPVLIGVMLGGGGLTVRRGYTTNQDPGKTQLLQVNCVRDRQLKWEI
jgi:hypothetical protein